jgi:hypothetical protein
VIRADVPGFCGTRVPAAAGGGSGKAESVQRRIRNSCAGATAPAQCRTAIQPLIVGERYIWNMATYRRIGGRHQAGATMSANGLLFRRC